MFFFSSLFSLFFYSNKDQRVPFEERGCLVSLIKQTLLDVRYLIAHKDPVINCITCKERRVQLQTHLPQQHFLENQELDLLRLIPRLHQHECHDRICQVICQRGSTDPQASCHRWGFFLRMRWPGLTLRGSQVQKELQHGEPFEGCP